jgi:hypothetical protein
VKLLPHCSSICHALLKATATLFVHHWCAKRNY